MSCPDRSNLFTFSANLRRSADNLAGQPQPRRNGATLAVGPDSSQSKSLLNAIDAQSIFLRINNSRPGSRTSVTTSLSDSASSHSGPEQFRPEAKLSPGPYAANRQLFVSGQMPTEFSFALNPRLLRKSPSLPQLKKKLPVPMDRSVCEIVEDFLFMGSIEAAFNANLLCRLEIGYIVDISNLEPSQVPREKKSDCPCLCPSQVPHSRNRFTVMIDEESLQDLVPIFDDVNKFISEARAKRSRVLVHSYRGQNRSAVIVLQYLMKAEGLSLIEAEKRLQAKVQARITENFFESLERWDELLRKNSAFQRKIPQSHSHTPHIRRSAWN